MVAQQCAVRNCHREQGTRRRREVGAGRERGAGQVKGRASSMLLNICLHVVFGGDSSVAVPRTCLHPRDSDAPRPAVPQVMRETALEAYDAFPVSGLSRALPLLPGSRRCRRAKSAGMRIGFSTQGLGVSATAKRDVRRCNRATILRHLQPAIAVPPHSSCLRSITRLRGD